MSRTRPSQLRLGLRRLAGARAINWVTFWISLALFTLDGFPVFFGAPLDGSTLSEPGLVVLASLVGQIGLFAVLLVAKYTYLSTVRALRHPAWTVWTFVVGSLVGDVIAVIAIGVVRPRPGEEPAGDLFSHVVYETLALCVIGVISVSLRDHREAVAQLQSAQQRLIAAHAAGLVALQTERELVIADVARSVGSAISDLRGDEPARAVAVLTVASEEMLRPLSHELATKGPDFAVPDVLSPPRPSWRSVLGQVAGEPLIRPRLMAAVMTLLVTRLTITSKPVPAAAESASTTVGPLTLSISIGQVGTALLELLTVFVATWLAAELVYRLTAPRLQRLTLGRRWLVILTGLAAIAVVAQALITLAFHLPGFPPASDMSPWALVLFIVPLALIALAVGIIRATAIWRAHVREQMVEVNEALAWQVARTNENLWKERRDLSRMLHGPLRAAFTAGAIQIDNAAREGEVPPELVAEVRDRIEGNLTNLRSLSPEPVRARHELDQIRSLWTGVCEVKLDASPDDIALLDVDNQCAAAVVEIVGEACANAVIHARADRVSVSLGSHDQRLFEVVVRNDGMPLAAPSQAGLGQRMLDEVSVEWSLTADEHGTTLRALLPVDSCPRINRDQRHQSLT